MKKLRKKELEIIVTEISSKISKIKKEKLISTFEESIEGKRMRELEKSIESKLVGVNKELFELRSLRNKFIEEKLGNEDHLHLLDLHESRDLKFGWGFSVQIRVGEGYDGGYGGIAMSRIKDKVEKELVLEGLKREFDLEEVVKGMIEKFS